MRCTSRHLWLLPAPSWNTSLEPAPRSLVMRHLATIASPYIGALPESPSSSVISSNPMSIQHSTSDEMKGVLRSTMPIALLLLAAALVSVTSGELTAAAPASDFIRLSCRSTLYPALCVQCLSSYGPTVRRSPRQLASAALAVSADRARDATTYVGRMSGGPRASRSRDGGALRDCMETLSDSVDRLQRSVRELSRPGRRGTARFRWRVSNVKTWVSAALTDQNTCLESLNEDKAAVVTGGARAAIRRKILDVAHVTSNALALVNRMAGGN